MLQKKTCPRCDDIYLIFMCIRKSDLCYQLYEQRTDNICTNYLLFFFYNIISNAFSLCIPNHIDISYTKETKNKKHQE